MAKLEKLLNTMYGVVDQDIPFVSDDDIPSEHTAPTADNIAYPYRVLAWQKMQQFWLPFVFKTEAEARASAEALGKNGAVQLVRVLWQSDNMPEHYKRQPKQTP